jgi:hypothetical protein
MCDAHLNTTNGFTTRQSSLVEMSADEVHKGSIMVWQELLHQILHMEKNKQVNYSGIQLSHTNF